MCLSVYGYYGTTGYGVAYKQYEQIQNNEIMKDKGQFSQKDGIQEIWCENKPIHAANNVPTGFTLNQKIVGFTLNQKIVSWHISLKPLLSKL